MESPSLQVSVSRYKGGRYWAVWLNGELLAVTVYKKGAATIRETILGLKESTSNSLSD